MRFIKSSSTSIFGNHNSFSPETQPAKNFATLDSLPRQKSDRRTIDHLIKNSSEQGVFPRRFALKLRHGWTDRTAIGP
ncbi:hypothetical protein JTE90_015972 [Oedothorax gibbosus]|uniref:Uncharacterized protein n=1 Tax=Oedothorax gibbosus TaxID=931172 RepID=A0AAV6VUL0_9ARAC|nr:hypothetical protein JTE90_015972 [Oedothorax gibbosus]